MSGNGPGATTSRVMNRAFARRKYFLSPSCVMGSPLSVRTSAAAARATSTDMPFERNDPKRAKRSCRRSTLPTVLPRAWAALAQGGACGRGELKRCHPRSRARWLPDPRPTPRRALQRSATRLHGRPSACSRGARQHACERTQGHRTGQAQSESRPDLPTTISATKPGPRVSECAKCLKLLALPRGLEPLFSP